MGVRLTFARGHRIKRLARAWCLLETLGVTRSAERLGVSQPMASRGLARLRAALGDESSCARGATPAPRAERCAWPLVPTPPCPGAGLRPAR
ncbi:MAG: LysR family transcriptional regulator [Deltaproteobacteria bacterium]|nr:LysR family transcriptional regulator [Deltaproteobacteria bacterium]